MEEKILEKVRKLLAKAESCSRFGTPEGDNEAKALSERAQEMIAEYAISEAMLGEAGKTREDVEVREIVIPSPYAKEKVTLLNVVGRVNRVRTVMSQESGARIKATVVGFTSDLDATDLLYTSLLSQMTSEMLAAPATTAWRSKETFRRNFMKGYTSRVGERLREANKRAEETVQASQSGQSVALVLRDRGALVDEKLRTLFPHLRRARSRSAYDPSGYSAGHAAGGRANLGQPGLGSRRALSA